MRMSKAASIVPSCSSSSTATTSPSTTHNVPSTSSSPRYLLQRIDDNSCFHNLGNFYLSGMFTDLTINCNGTHFRTHRVILASVSMFIKQKLLHPEDAPHHACCQHCITINQVPQEVMQSILNCIYHGKTPITERMLKPISDGLSFLRIRGLNITVKPRIQQDPADDEQDQSAAALVASLLDPQCELKIEDDDEEDLMEGADEEGPDEEDVVEGAEEYQEDSSSTGGGSGRRMLQIPPGALEPFTTMLVDGKEKPIFRCHLCGQIKSSKYILQRHIQYFHKTVKDIACRLCDSKVKYPSCLKRHVQNIHKITMTDYNRLVAHIRSQFEQPQSNQVQLIHNVKPAKN